MKSCKYIVNKEGILDKKLMESGLEQGLDKKSAVLEANLWKHSNLEWEHNHRLDYGQNTHSTLISQIIAKKEFYKESVNDCHKKRNMSRKNSALHL